MNAWCRGGRPATSEVLSASVAVRYKGDADEPITAANVEARLPDDATVDRVRAAFEELGFEVSQAFAGSFAITGPRSVFEDTFTSWTKDRFAPDSLASADAASLELAVEDVAELFGEIATDVAAIFFTAAPDFGPDNP